MEEEEDEKLLLMSYTEEHESKLDEVWFIDSGCSNHMTGNKLWFSLLDEKFKSTVRLGNNERMSVKGKSNIQLSIGGHVHTSEDVFLLLN